MKKIILLFIVTFLISVIAFGQTNNINYKAIIKDGSGDIVANQLITLQLSILKGVAQTNIYTETHTPTTNTNGLIILNIGSGTIISGVFANIDWANSDHFLNVQVDITGGTTFTDLGTTQFMAVPYAIHSLTSSNIVNQVNLSDIGVIAAFPGITYPNNTYLPLSGGTFDNADFPDFATFITNLSTEVITNNGDGTFTLANWNSNGTFLRGQGGNAGVLGTLQNNATALPNTNFKTTSTTASTSSNGTHNHGILTRQDNWDVSGGPLSGGPSFGIDNGSAAVYTATRNGGAHNHNVNIPSLNITQGGDIETRPLNRSITWMIKVKPSVAFGNNSLMKMANISSKNKRKTYSNNFKTDKQLKITKGDIFINSIQRGVVMKSPSGKCFRYQPNEKGLLEGKEIVCPDN